jgi:hypothetical protein
MFTELLAILGDSHFEAYIGGPLAGAIVGIVFTALGQPPSSSGSSTAKSPGDALDEIADRLSRIEARQGNSPKGQGQSVSDPSAFIFLALLLLIPLFLLVAYLPTVIQIVRVLIGTMTVFSITIALGSFVAGRFNTTSWWLHALFPVLANVACFWITDIAYTRMAPEVVNFAQSLLGTQQLSPSSVISAAIHFYRSISGEYVQWMVLHMCAFVLVGFGAILVALQSIHYVALANASVSSRRLWAWLAWKTRSYTSPATTVMTLFFLCAGWAAGTGRLYAWVH